MDEPLPSAPAPVHTEKCVATLGGGKNTLKEPTVPQLKHMAKDIHNHYICWKKGQLLVLMNRTTNVCYVHGITFIVDKDRDFL